MQLTAIGKSMSVGRRTAELHQTFLMIKLTILLLVAACLHVSAHSFGQTVTYSKKQASLEEIFEAIHQQTGLFFYYKSEDIKQAKSVNLAVRQQPVREVLDYCFANQPLTYLLQGEVIYVRKREGVLPVVDTLPSLIRGRIVDATGRPIAGATIGIKGGPRLMASSTSGEFSLEDISIPVRLEISSIGYTSTEVLVRSYDPIVITLSIEQSDLDESIVIGYGKTTRRFSTGSISKVNAQVIEKQPVSNPLAALQGRAPGLFITQRNGLPGSAFNILIRGRNSIQQGNEPLVVIDGVPFPINQLNQRNFINANHPLNTLNPLDIESIEILKDADATAIYGSRGANGVILITTKKGTSGTTQVDVQINTNWGRVTRVPTFLSTQQYLSMRKEAFANDNVVPTLANAPDLLLWDSTAYTDWSKVLVGNTASTWQGQLGLSGGSQWTRFSFSTNYYKETTVFPTELGTSRYSGRFQVDHQSKDNRLHFSLTSSYSAEDSRLVNTDLTNSLSLPPNLPDLFDENGNLVWEKGGIGFPNPFRFLKEQFRGRMDRFTTNSVLSYRVFKGFELKLSSGFNTLQLSENSRYPKAAQNPQFANARSNFANNRTQTWIIEPQAEYRTTWGNHRIGILVGGSYQDSRNQLQTIDASGYPNDNVLEGTAGATNIVTQVGGSTYRYGGHFARINYDYRKSLLLTLSGRRDGSSRFGPANRMANFGAIGGGWLFHQLKGMEKVVPFLSFGKIRSSWGTTGNDQIGNYQYLDTWVPTTFPYGGVAGFRPTRLFNPDYRWEQIRKLDVGLELRFWQDRLQFNTTWFHSKSSNQIVFYNLPSQTGFTNVLMNFPGVVVNKGWEFDFTYNNKSTNKWKWTSQFNLTIPLNELVEFPGLETSSYAQTYQIGQPLNLFWGYPFEGLNPQTGLYSFTSASGASTSSPNRVTDFRVLGTTNPTLYGGWSNSVVKGGWQFDLFLQFVQQQGRDVFFSTGSPAGTRSNVPKEMLNRWQKAGDNASYQGFSQQSFGPAYTAAFAASTSSAAFVDASFIRLKNVQLSYQLPKGIVQQLRMSMFKLFIQAQNVLTITSYAGGDPETQSRNTLPPLRVISIGIQSSF